MVTPAAIIALTSRWGRRPPPLSGLDEAKVYYLAVIAYDAYGNESDPSNEVIYELEEVDTDGDGLSDWHEINFYKTDPYKADNDGDGLSDGDEMEIYKTDPTQPDTDGDGVPDGVEVSKGSNPLDPLSIPISSEVVFAVNAGGPAYTAADGTMYQADTRFSGGKTHAETAAIAGTADAWLYQSERDGNFSYAIPVVNGDYIVTLKFAELYHTAVGRRIFDVLIEGQMVVCNLDLYATVGRYTAHDVAIPVTVSDGARYYLQRRRIPCHGECHPRRSTVTDFTCARGPRRCFQLALMQR